RLAGAGEPREDDQPVPRQIEVDVLEVMRAGAADLDGLHRVVGPLFGGNRKLYDAAKLRRKSMGRRRSLRRADGREVAGEKWCQRLFPPRARCGRERMVSDTIFPTKAPDRHPGRWPEKWCLTPFFVGVPPDESNPARRPRNGRGN